MKGNIKTVLLVAGGVLLAGYIMSKGRGSVQVIADAHDGFDS